jgi:hypothetical protein
MLTIEAKPDGGGLPRLALRSRWWINLDYMTSGVTSVLAALPIALVAADGWAQAAGWVYLVVWVVVLLPSFLVYGWMIGDAWKLFRYEEPSLLRRSLQFRATLLRAGKDHRTIGMVSRLAKFSMYANPITNLATTLTIQALRWRSAEVEALWRSILSETARAQMSQLEPQVSKAAAIASPILERTSPEFAMC